ncbi:MAG: hypothetical protein ABSA53_37080 [Streptosporangiaceae bacterium]
MYSHDLLESRLKGRRIGWVVVAGLGFLLFVAVGGNALLAGFGVIHDSSEPQGTKTILLAVPWFALAIACAAVAIHFEHRLRGFPSGKIALGLSTARNTMPVGLRTPRRRRYGPVSTLISAIVFLGIGIAAACFAVSTHSEADRSTYTQANGIAGTATVRSVANYDSSGRYSTSYFAKVTVSLQTPVSGQASTVVNIPGNVSYAPGQVISILVDPADPGYAELPGSPYVTDSTTAGLVIAAAVGCIIGVSGIVSAVGMRRRQHAWRAVRPAAPA